jgi:hypothetical protein
MKCTVRHAVQERFYLLLQDVSEKVQWQRVWFVYCKPLIRN